MSTRTHWAGPNGHRSCAHGKTALHREVSEAEFLQLPNLCRTCERAAEKVSRHRGEAMTKPYRPSNGTEGYFFIEKQCGGCAKANTCRIPRETMRYDEDHPSYPKEWVSDEDGQNPRCTAREVTT